MKKPILGLVMQVLQVDSGSVPKHKGWGVGWVSYSHVHLLL